MGYGSSDVPEPGYICARIRGKEVVYFRHGRWGRVWFVCDGRRWRRGDALGEVGASLVDMFRKFQVLMGRISGLIEDYTMYVVVS